MKSAIVFAAGAIVGALGFWAVNKYALGTTAKN